LQLPIVLLYCLYLPLHHPVQDQQRLCLFQPQQQRRYPVAV
jgi:hypothetical protein